jgi:DNA-directed RNA polymerase subunit omega
MKTKGDIINADIQELYNKTNSAYKLVILAARRAIELSEGAAKLIEAASDEKVTNIAIHEILQGRITYKVKNEK